MKRSITIALCALFSLSAGASTLYVDAKRPNNKGNGFSAKTAKKTIQAAINIAKKGDTIVVLPGEYASPLKTKNKSIKIKSKKGAGKTFVRAQKMLFTDYSLDFGGGTSTLMTGFTVTPKKSSYGYYTAGGVRGGTLSKCTLIELEHSDGYRHKWTLAKSKLVDCILNNCGADTCGNYAWSSTLTRCKMEGGSGGKIKSCKFDNTLITKIYGHSLESCVLANCTVADNSQFSMKTTKAYNTIFYKVSSAIFQSKKKNKFKRCYKGSNPRFAGKIWVADKSGTGYYRPDYHLAKSSPCINKGTKAKSVKKLFGSKDLDGKKRIRGKSVDIGCYEY